MKPLIRTVAESRYEAAANAQASSPKDLHRTLRGLLLRAKRRAATLAQQSGRPPGSKLCDEVHVGPHRCPASASRDIEESVMPHSSNYEVVHTRGHDLGVSSSGTSVSTTLSRYSTKWFIVYQLCSHGEATAMTLADAEHDPAQAIVKGAAVRRGR